VAKKTYEGDDSKESEDWELKISMQTLVLTW